MLQHYLETRFESWFKRRSPLTKTAKLNMHNVYIFLSKEGIMYAILLLVTFVAGTNYANNLVLGLCFLLIGLLVITIHYTFAHLAGLQIQLVDVANATEGEWVQIRLQVSGNSRQPHRQIRFSFGAQVYDLTQPLQNPVQSVNQTPNQTLSQTLIVNQIAQPQIISLYVAADKRGRFDLPKLTVSTVYPLGILRAWSYVFLDGYAWIYPRALPYDVKAKQFVLSTDENIASLQTRAGQEDFDQLDNYVTGESLARISWAHLAKGQGLLSKRFVDNVGQQQVLDYYQMPSTTHEDKLRQLRYGVDRLSQQQIAFRLILPNDDGIMGQGLAFQQDSLLRLAKAP
ncbi:hypothetical protein MOMA_04460 [Moraxella macacae 0408225]|uniref:Uncharacterized protein n=1 Tax=Moraxella macacae 0408225 TaxID=1230338 RepID=L2FB15_9GAMM|nr:DUF58 domain-containing protein [Moraxella macacae]ELA09628.1 hypothetical protein MOMA_04460 [Moraxella macacae 0408225]